LGNALPREESRAGQDAGTRITEDCRDKGGHSRRNERRVMQTAEEGPVGDDSRPRSETPHVR